MSGPATAPEPEQPEQATTKRLERHDTRRRASRSRHTPAPGVAVMVEQTRKRAPGETSSATVTLLDVAGRVERDRSAVAAAALHLLAGVGRPVGLHVHGVRRDRGVVGRRLMGNALATARGNQRRQLLRRRRRGRRRRGRLGAGATERHDGGGATTIEGDSTRRRRGGVE